MGNIKINGVDYSGGGASSWDELTNKPFETIGTGLSVDEEGNLNAEGEAIPDNVAYLGGEAEPSVPTPRDADTLEGHPSSYFAKASDVREIKTKVISGTTNPNGIIFKGSSDMEGDEIVISAYCTSSADVYCVIGFGGSNGNWIKVMNYDNSPLANATVSINIYYI